MPLPPSLAGSTRALAEASEAAIACYYHLRSLGIPDGAARATVAAYTAAAVALAGALDADGSSPALTHEGAREGDDTTEG